MSEIITTITTTAIIIIIIIITTTTATTIIAFKGAVHDFTPGGGADSNSSLAVGAQNIEDWVNVSELRGRSSELSDDRF